MVRIVSTHGLPRHITEPVGPDSIWGWAANEEAKQLAKEEAKRERERRVYQLRSNYARRMKRLAKKGGSDE